jgi:hypothetical protein
VATIGCSRRYVTGGRDSFAAVGFVEKPAEQRQREREWTVNSRQWAVDRIRNSWHGQETGHNMLPDPERVLIEAN